MRVFLAGATGAIGRPLLRGLVAAGHTVVGMTRSAQRAGGIRDAGATPLVCDAFDGDRLRASMAEFRPEAVLNELTAIPQRVNPRRVPQEFAATNRLRTEGNLLLAEAARAAGARRFVAQSVAFAYGAEGAGLATEEEPLHPSPPAAFAATLEAARQCERVTLACGLEGVVLRYGFFHGPGTPYAPDGSFAEDVRGRRMPLVGDGGGTFSFVHVEDAADATVRALTAAMPGIYNVVDDHPTPVREWLPRYAASLGAPPPRQIPVWLARVAAGPYAVHLMTALRGASNRKAREALGWMPHHPRFPPEPAP